MARGDSARKRDLTTQLASPLFGPVLKNEEPLKLPILHDDCRLERATNIEMRCIQGLAASPRMCTECMLPDKDRSCWFDSAMHI